MEGKFQYPCTVHHLQRNENNTLEIYNPTNLQQLGWKTWFWQWSGESWKGKKTFNFYADSKKVRIFYNFVQLVLVFHSNFDRSQTSKERMLPTWWASFNTPAQFIILLYLSGLNVRAAILNKEQYAMVAAKTKKPN